MLRLLPRNEFRLGGFVRDIKPRVKMRLLRH